MLITHTHSINTLQQRKQFQWFGAHGDIVEVKCKAVQGSNCEDTRVNHRNNDKELHRKKHCQTGTIQSSLLCLNIKHDKPLRNSLVIFSAGTDAPLYGLNQLQLPHRLVKESSTDILNLRAEAIRRCGVSYIIQSQKTMCAKSDSLIMRISSLTLSWSLNIAFSKLHV